MNAWLGVIAAVLSIIIGLWKFFGAKAAAKRERIKKADAQFAEGMAERDPSKITAGNDRINNDV